MHTISDYSQWGEQAIILDFFKKNPPKSKRALEIGAFDGVEGSNCRALAEMGWHVLSIEAAPRAFSRLLENRNGLDIEYLHAAIMPTPGLVRFVDTEPRPDTTIPVSAGQCSTCRNQHHVENMAQRFYYVAAVTPMDVALQFGTFWDFISLDIEGVDLEVLKVMGMLLPGTSLLCVEDTIPGTEYDENFYQELRASAAAHGFTKLFGRTDYAIEHRGGERRWANSLLTRP